MSRQVKDIATELATPILEEMDLELVDVEFKKEGKHWFLRLFIDGKNGVDIEQCGRVSEQLSDKLDEIDPIKQSYYLEVSSPGAERPLKNEEDVKQAVGKNVYVTTYEPIDGQKQFEGLLVAYEEEQLVIEIKEKQKTVTSKVPYRLVAKARLAVVI